MIAAGPVQKIFRNHGQRLYSKMHSTCSYAITLKLHAHHDKGVKELGVVLKETIHRDTPSVLRNRSHHKCQSVA